MRRTLCVLPSIALLLVAVVVPLAANAESTAVTERAIVKVAFNKKLKSSILVDSRGMTLYMWSDDVGGTPTCYNDPRYHCAKAWPPLLTTGAPRAGQGVRASLLGVVRRTGGKSQVTYKQHPLYTNAGSPTFGLIADKKPGDVNGQNFSGWYVLTPKGTPITRTP